jgi:hypothetical protein
MPTSIVVQGMRALRTAGRVHGMRGLYHVLRTKLYWRAQYVRFHVDLGEWAITPPGGKGDVEAREGTFEELQQFRDLRGKLPIQFYADQTHGGRRFHLGICDGRIGHISWVYSEPDRVRHMTLGPGDIMMEGAYTFADARRRGLLPAVERAALNDAKREGMRHAYTHVSTDNRASLRGVWKTGFRPIGLLTWRWVLGVSHTRHVDNARLATLAAGLETPAVASA